MLRVCGKSSADISNLIKGPLKDVFGFVSVLHWRQIHFRIKGTEK